MKSKAAGLPLSYRLAVASRCLAALLGGYLLASMASVCIALLAPLSRVDATLIGLLLSFVFYLLAFIWCFACRSAWRAWLGVLLPSLLMAMASGIAYWMKTP
ncbi:DUF3649 domain-containing protein [Pseudomonas sp. P1B16]|jgi:hypothetical protein|uniref:DUF3649 domain-containing protein n=1 Tax=Pseudomonas capeferrum TaxID=1495066 RepID=A0ABY7R7K6_9PSED|nr:MULTISPECIES: DUF3649 domain-containing protein [Pseudomonas]KEY85582.1 hypothetical protein PC358_24115 [Pseudomonas capeferrum]KGI93586.1 hypothetical protein MD26_09650 [Pseudomonas sp. H2]MCH7297950.1 DUF3649 domain-containing protein [Pseudomonas capeferrum]MDD2063965.1 DUF3649 domain-containing protein [Pseudomonas sp. 25571]MDD2130371.1 DUF3649 domain-containing protein [Pseudomonas sp. 17391]